MSNKYKTSADVPTEVLSARLRELSAVASKPIIRDSELTMRIPAELDRDADLVLSESASRLEQLHRRVALLERQLKTADKTIEELMVDS